MVAAPTRKEARTARLVHFHMGKTSVFGAWPEDPATPGVQDRGAGLSGSRGREEEVSGDPDRVDGLRGPSCRMRSWPKSRAAGTRVMGGRMRVAAGYVLSVLALHGALRAQALPPDLGFLKYTLTGEEAGDVYGHSLAAMGDLDADGWPDFAMGSIEVVRDPDALGEVLLVSGKSGKIIRSIRHAEAFRFG